jgi:hypothetical protein
MDAVGHYFVGCMLCITFFLAGFAGLGGVVALWIRWDFAAGTRDEPPPPWTASLLLIGASAVLFVLGQTVAKFWGWPQ